MAKLFQLDKESTQPPSSSQFASSTSHPSEWTYQDKILLETLLVRFTPNEPNRWKKMSSMMSNRTADEIREYYENNYRTSMENVTADSSTETATKLTMTYGNQIMK